MVADAGLDNTGQRSGGWDATGQETAGPKVAAQEKAGFGETCPRDHAEPELPDPGKLAEDWITVWQSELSAMAADPEIRESWQSVMALWAGTLSTVLQGLPRAGGPNAGCPNAGGPNAREADAWQPGVWSPDGGGYDRPGGQTGSADAARASPAAAAPDARDAEVERLARHVAALERRLAEFERGGDPPVAAKRRPGRKPRG